MIGLAAGTLIIPISLGAMPASAVPATSTISGTVTRASDHTPVADVFVTAYKTGFEATACYIECAFVLSGQTDVAGNFSLAGLPAGSYSLSVDDYTPSDQLATQWYSGRSTYATATAVTVAAGQTLTGIDFALASGASASGTLSIAGTSTSDVMVSLFEKAGKLWHLAGNVAYLSAQGPYTSTSSLPAGTYRVGFTDMATSPSLAPSFSSNQPNAESGSDVTITAGQAISNLDASMSSFSPKTVSDVARISGADRYATSVAIAQHGFPSGAPVVFVATGTNYPDALAAGPAAAKLGGPLLLTQPTALPSSVAAEVQALNPHKIYVVGGTGAVSDSVVSDLQAIAPSASVARVAGTDRYDTGRKVVQLAFGGSGAVPGAYLATGANFPDALSAAAAAGVQSEPVILVNGAATTLDQPTSSLISSLGLSYATVVGGPSAVSAGIVTGLQNLIQTISTTNGIGVRVIAGPDRYATSALIAKDAFLTVDTAYVATGTQFPDALAASALAGESGYPLLTVQPDCVPQVTLAQIGTLGVTQLNLIGGTSALGTGVQSLKQC
ncbi:MAG TPA: cell wall-binding repeat-containing protein [Microbacteriaceae bacterium]